MVEVSVTASVKVAGGPTVPLGTTLNPESYTYASVDLDADATTEHQVDLLPIAGTVVLLALVVKNPAGPAGPTAAVSVTPVNGAKKGSPLTIDGPLLIANDGVLAALVAGGPRTLTMKNTGAVPVTVEVFTCLDLP
jgi:hypothetical protein